MSLQLPVSNRAHNSATEFKVHELDTEVPSGLPEPSLYRLIMMPVRIRRKSRGGIILTDDLQDAALWHHQLFKVVAVGKQVWRGESYKQFSITEEDRPHVGELWLINPRAPDRFVFDGIQLVVVADDGLRCRVTDTSEETLSKFKFNGLDL